MIILAGSFVRVRNNFMFYHKEAYQDIMKALWQYFIFDVIGFSVGILNSVLLLAKVDVVNANYSGFVLLILFPFV
jgi:hypothetical protein